MEKTNILKELAREASKGKYYNEIDIAKGITIILVIIGHALPSLNGEVPKGFPSVLMQVIYSFHMPVFFFLSGLLAKKILYLKKIEWGFLASKAKRLMIPYFFCGVLYLIMKWAMSKMLGIKGNSSALWKIFVGINPNYELWFLYVLFMCFVISTLLVRRKSNIVAIVIAAIASICFGFLTEDGFAILNTVAKICKNTVFFITGIYIGTIYDNIKNKINWIVALVSLPIFVVANIVIANTKIVILSNAAKLLSSLTGIIIVLWISIVLSKTIISSPTINLGKNSMCIYIISGFVLPLLSKVLFDKIGTPYSLTVVICTILTIIISLLVSFVIKKIKYLRLLMFGMD